VIVQVPLSVRLFEPWAQLKQTHPGRRVYDACRSQNHPAVPALAGRVRLKVDVACSRQGTFPYTAILSIPALDFASNLFEGSIMSSSRIDISDFETQRTAFEFADLAFAALERLHTGDYFLRTPDSKVLVEEIVPIAVFAKTLEAPELRLMVSHTGAVEQFDGTIQVSGVTQSDGYMARNYYLEVTSAIFEPEHYLREGLAQSGSVFLGPHITKDRVTGEIVSKATARNRDAPLEDLENWIVKAIELKSKKDKKSPYPTPCILLVRVEPEFTLSLCQWARMVKAVTPTAEETLFEMVFLVQTTQCVAHLVHRKPR
jgi:hypothetical protein